MVPEPTADVAFCKGDVAEDIAEFSAGRFKARCSDVGDVVRDCRNVSLGAVEAGESGIEGHVSVTFPRNFSRSMRMGFSI